MSLLDFCIPGVWNLEVRAQRSTTVSFMDAKTDLSLMYDSLEWDEAFMILGLRNHVTEEKYGWSSETQLPIFKGLFVLDQVWFWKSQKE